MSMPSEITMQRLTTAVGRAADLRPELVETLGIALDHLEWATERGLATDATWRDLTACIAAAVIDKEFAVTPTPDTDDLDDPVAVPPARRGVDVEWLLGATPAELARTLEARAR